MFSLSGSPGGEKQRMYVSHEGSVKILQSCREKKEFIITEMSAKVISKTHTQEALQGTQIYYNKNQLILENKKVAYTVHVLLEFFN